MADVDEVEFIRRSLVIPGLVTADRLAAWLSAWDGETSLFRHLVTLGVLERSGANTLDAVRKGYVVLAPAAQFGLFKLAPPAAVPEAGGRARREARAQTDVREDRSGEAVREDRSGEAVRADGVPTQRPTAAEVATPWPAPAGRGDEDPAVSPSRGSRGSMRVPAAARLGQTPASSPELHAVVAAAVDAALSGPDEPAQRRPIAEEVARLRARAAALGRPGAVVREDRPEAVREDRSRGGPESGAPAASRADRPAASGPQVGDLVAGYQLRAALGHGARGAVYRAWSLAQGHSVVLKLLRAEDGASRAGAAAQAAVHWRVLHPGVVKLLAVGEHDGAGYLVYEDLGAQGLADHVAARGPLAPACVAQLGVDVAQTLAAAAEVGVAHGDLKPDHLLVYGPELRVKLTDFAAPGGPRRPAPAYVAPERVGARGPADARADMYSLGATLSRAATGGPPFVRASGAATLQGRAPAEAPPVHALARGFSRELSAVIGRLLHARADARFATWGEVVAALVAAEPGVRRTLSVPEDMSSRTAEAGG